MADQKDTVDTELDPLARLKPRLKSKTKPDAESGALASTPFIAKTDAEKTVTPPKPLPSAPQQV